MLSNGRDSGERRHDPDSNRRRLYGPQRHPMRPPCRTRGVVALDGLALYDYGGVTAFDAAGGCGDGAGEIGRASCRERV